jgi:hypothetical protein
MRDHRLPSLVSLLPVLLCLLCLPPSQAAERPPNIILVMADDLGMEAIPCYGAEGYQTPTLDVWMPAHRFWTALGSPELNFLDNTATCLP